MTKPTTMTGRHLAAFLGGLFPETEQFSGQIAHIEREARDQGEAAVIWYIDFTTNFPHWGVAYIEADTAEQAREILKRELMEEHDTVWRDEVLPPERWDIREAKRPFRFILGQGCR